MRVYYALLSLLHAAFALVLVSFSQSPLLTLTIRRQFDDWHPLLDAFRTAESTNATGLLDSALSLSWCNETLPPNTTRAPYCACVARVHGTFSNASHESLAKARDDAVVDLVKCLADRPVWRVTPVWSVSFTTPAVYALFVSACFLWLAADLPMRYSTLPLWALTGVLVVVLLVHDYVHNSFWVFTFVVVMVLIDWILLPGMASLAEPQQQEAQSLLSMLLVVTRTPSCFWWCQYLVTPVFALYVPLMHCGRDLLFTSVFTMIGTAVGGLGLRSFWCAQAYTAGPKAQFRQVMQYIVWLGILAACVSLSFMTGIYYSADVPYAMGRGSVALLVLTFFVGLLQWPGNQDFEQLLFTQMALSLARNIAFFSIVLWDVMQK